MDILQEFSTHDFQGIFIPLSTTSSLRLNDGSPSTDVKKYQSATGKLQYLSFTIPYISFGFNNLSKFIHHPSHIHEKVVKHLFMYLISTIHHGLLFRHGSNSYLMFIPVTT